MLFLPRPGLVSVTEEVTMGWWDIISSFISELCPIQQTGSVLNRGLNKCLIILHFLDTCVNDCSLIKKKCINMSSPLTFPNTKGTLQLLKFLVVSDRNRRMPAVLRNWVFYLLSQCSSHLSLQPPSHSAASDQFRVKPVQVEQITPVCPSHWLSVNTWTNGDEAQLHETAQLRKTISKLNVVRK